MLLGAFLIRSKWPICFFLFCISNMSGNGLWHRCPRCYKVLSKVVFWKAKTCWYVFESNMINVLDLITDMNINDQIAESRLLVFHKKQFISLLCRQWLLRDDHKFTSAIKNIGLVEITQAGHYWYYSVKVYLQKFAKKIQT